MFQYSSVVVRSISPNLSSYALRHQPQYLDLAIAENQHKQLIHILENIGLNVFHINSYNYPDSVFIEDTAVAIDKTILLTNPGAISRKGEIGGIRKFLLTNEFIRKNYRVTQLSNGTIDGGDVLFTGKEIFVGKSNRSNELGIKSFAKVFHQYPTYTIELSELNSSLSKFSQPLHLKSFCSMGGNNHILVGGKIGEALINKINNLSSYKYKFTSLPDEAAANCLLVNNKLIRRSNIEYPNSSSIFTQLQNEFKDIKQIEIIYNELSKVDGALTCCCLFI